MLLRASSARLICIMKSNRIAFCVNSGRIAYDCQFIIADPNEIKSQIKYLQEEYDTSTEDLKKIERKVWGSITQEYSIRHSHYEQPFCSAMQGILLQTEASNVPKKVISSFL